MKRPAFQFYPGDWLNDSALRVVSVGARGAWMDMICLMHQAQPYGYLKVNGKVILPANLSRILGATLAQTNGFLIELEEAGVFSRDESGCIYSRRMIRDEQVRTARAAGGKLGGNPNLKAAPDISGRLTSKVKVKPTPSSSSSSSSSVEPNQEPPQDSTSRQSSDSRNVSATPTEKTDDRIARSLPKGWLPSEETKAQMRAECPMVTDHDAVTREFVDYWQSISGAKSRRTNWESTWKNRVREISSRIASRSRAGPVNGSPGVAANFSQKTYEGTPDDELPEWLRPSTLAGNA